MNTKGQFINVAQSSRTHSMFCFSPDSGAETRLIMVEEAGCVWCARWNEQIGPIYPKTPEGRTAPLRRIDIHATQTDDLNFTSSLNFTPTFILMVDGLEVSRLEGYPGEDFFWGLLAEMISNSKVSWAK